MRQFLLAAFFIVSLATFVQCKNVDNVVYFQPEQVHISFGENTDEIIVMWSTRNSTNQSIVVYGEDFRKVHSLKYALGSSSLFVDGGPKKSSQYIHTVLLTNLKPRTRYEYNCGSDFGWSAKFSFVTPPQGHDWSPSLAIYGDMGNENAQSLARLQQDTQKGMYDAIIHVGDFAYDMDTDDAEVGDAFMRQIESIAAYVPYIVCPGNHEEKYNFSNYKSRFSPLGQEKLWYSFDMGPIHFVSFSTEVYYFLNYGYKLLTKQYQWLENDLKEANKPENRALRPWIITFGHRPMYCSDDKEYDCNDKLETYIRQGLPVVKMFGLEDLFYKYGVDVEFFAHEHFYTRLWPIYDFKVYNGSIEAPYTNAKAPIQIITGSAGCNENREPFSKVLPEWNAFHSNDYGYTRLKAHNGTHLYFEQVSDDKNGDIIDSFWIIKDKHGAYSDM
uniref:Purple acid phosphatase n=1 Tax=Haematobia irritans TaxID=7368 RepID=A0A1L8EFG2_HAEIR